jgi:hypothetical protein
MSSAKNQHRQSSMCSCSSALLANFPGHGFGFIGSTSCLPASGRRGLATANLQAAQSVDKSTHRRPSTYKRFVPSFRRVATVAWGNLQAEADDHTGTAIRRRQRRRMVVRPGRCPYCLLEYEIYGDTIWTRYWHDMDRSLLLPLSTFPVAQCPPVFCLGSWVGSQRTWASPKRPRTGPRPGCPFSTRDMDSQSFLCIHVTRLLVGGVIAGGGPGG